MKNNIIVFSKILISFVILSTFSISCSADNRTYKIGVISDIHYLSQQLMDDGEAINKYITSSGRNVLDVPEILDLVINDYIDNDIEILLIPGDLTKDGEKESHLELVQKLKPLQDKGVRIFVIPGNHDINIPNPKSYSGSQTHPTSNINAADFENIYYSFGYSDAIKRDTASLSYLNKIDDHIWLLALDASLYKEYTTSSISSGRISKSTEKWISQVLAEAKQKNITVISMMHHGLVEHFAYQSTFFPQYLVDDWYRLANFLSDNGVKAIFTGHFHANDISEFISTNGNKIYDIQTGSLSSYPFAYRYIELTKEGMDITTKNILSTKSNPNLVEENKSNLKKLAQTLAYQKIKNKKPDLSPDIIQHLSDIARELFLLHVAGDENINNSLKQQIEQAATGLNMPVDLSSDFLQLDLPPADNDVKISF